MNAQPARTVPRWGVWTVNLKGAVGAVTVSYGHHDWWSAADWHQ